MRAWVPHVSKANIKSQGNYINKNIFTDSKITKEITDNSAEVLTHYVLVHKMPSSEDSAAIIPA